MAVEREALQDELRQAILDAADAQARESIAVKRAEAAEALLREALPWTQFHLRDAIAAHLDAEADQ